MSNLQPIPGTVTFGGVERHFYFDYAAIELIQELSDRHPLAVINSIFYEDEQYGGMYRAKPVIDLTHILLNNEVSREKCLSGGTDLKVIDRETVSHMIDRDNANDIVKAIIAAWMNQTPTGEKEEDEEPEDQPE